MICALLSTTLNLTPVHTAGASALVEGHRGARGLYPENSLPGFRHALELGVDVLELDVGLTRDGVVVVVHDRTLNPDLVRERESGNWVAPGLALWRLHHADLQRFVTGTPRTGSTVARRFASQRAVRSTPIPTLRDVFALTREMGHDHVRFNIETKLRPDRPRETASPEVFADAVAATIEAAGLTARSNVQSFDWRTLAYLRARKPGLRLAALTAEQSWLDNIQRNRPGTSPWTAGLDIDEYDGSLPRLVHALGAHIWSPYYKELDARQVAQAHSLGLEIAVWTVNSVPDMRQMLLLGVDSIITDYPDRLIALLRARGERP